MHGSTNPATSSSRAPSWTPTPTQTNS